MKALIFFLLLWVQGELAEAQNCIQTNTDPTGNFTQTNTSCTFIITSKSSTNIALRVNKVALQGNDTLVIYDGEKHVNTSVASYTSGSNVGFQVIVGFSHNMTVVYTTSKVGSVWSLDYDTTKCNVSVENIWTSRLDSPLYKLKPSAVLNCTYNVINTASPPDHKAVVSISQFNLTGNSNFTLSYGNFSVPYTDNSRRDDFFVERTNTFVVGINIANASTTQSFSLLVSTVTAGCSGVVALKGSYTWTQLPPQSVSYECRWLIHTNSSANHIVANISSLDIAPNSDRLSFIDGGSSNGLVLATVTADVKDYIVTGLADSMIVSLVLDNTDRQRSIDLTVTESDSWIRLVGQGYLGGQYKKDDTSYYQLIASEGELVNVEVLTELPEGSTVTFYNGLQLSDKEIVVLRHKAQNLKNVIGNANMLVKLSGFKDGTSFNASFTSIKPGCDMLVTSSSGQISFSEQTGLTCYLTVAPQVAESTIIMNVDFVELGESESLKIYQGLNDTVPLAQFFGPQKTRLNPLQIYIPTTDTASIVITKAAAAASTPRVLISYQTVFNVCGGSFNENTFSILTPNYPNQYPLNAHCIWTPPDVTNQLLFLSFQDLALVQNHSISVVDNSNKTAPQVIVSYGSIPQGPVHLPADQVLNLTRDIQIEFQSSQSLEKSLNQVGRGVNITSRIIECGGTFNENGSFHTNGYPAELKSSSSCVWIVDVKEPDKNTTNIVNFTIDASDPKYFAEYVTIYDGDSIRSEFLGINITEKRGILSRYNAVVVVLNYDAKKPGKAGFQFNFTTKTCNEFCANGVCLHADWRCNGEDDCGDNTDEKNCVNPTTPLTPITTPPSAESYSGWVKSGWVPACLFIGVLLGAILVFAVPKIIRRMKARGGNYSRMGDNTANA